MRIAYLGLKGLPGLFGGVERHVEELSSRISAAGHDVTVFCRKAYTPAEGEYLGVKLRLLPTIHSKHLDATIHSFIGSIYAGLSDFDIIHFHGIGPASFSVISKMLGRKVVVTVHSKDYLRSKWGKFARWALLKAEWIASKTPNQLIAVSNDLANHLSQYNRNVHYIPNGVSDPVWVKPGINLEELDLKPQTYLLFAGRLSPEKGVMLLIDSYKRVPGSHKLVIVGGTSHTDEYVEELQRTAGSDSRIIFAGYRNPDAMQELYSNALGFVLPSEHEGLPVAALEALSYGLPIIASDIPPCREILNNKDEFFGMLVEPKKVENWTKSMNDFLKNPMDLQKKADRGSKFVAKYYHWDVVAQKTLQVYHLLGE